jgi:hypothetical protein
MWNLSGFSYYHWRNNSTNLFDQFIISRSLLLGVQKLKMNLDKVMVYNEGLTIVENLSDDYFISIKFRKISSCAKGNSNDL